MGMSAKYLLELELERKRTKDAQLLSINAPPAPTAGTQLPTPVGIYTPPSPAAPLADKPTDTPADTPADKPADKPVTKPSHPRRTQNL